MTLPACPQRAPTPTPTQVLSSPPQLAAAIQHSANVRSAHQGARQGQASNDRIATGARDNVRAVSESERSEVTQTLNDRSR